MLMMTYGIQKSTGRGASLFSLEYAWFSAVWLVQFFVLCLPIYEYLDPISATSALYMVLSHFAFAMGSVVVMVFRPRVVGEQSDISSISGSRIFIQASAIVGAGAQFILFVNNIVGSGISISDRLNQSAFAKVRLMNFEFNSYFLGPLYGVFSILSSLAYVSIAYFAFCWARNERWARTISIETVLVAGAAAVLFAHQLLVAGGRIGIVFVLLLVIIPAFIAKTIGARRVPRSKIVGRTFVTVVIVFLLTLISAVFQQFRGNNHDPFLEMVDGHGTVVTSEIYNPVRDNKFLGFYILQTSYLTTPPHVLGVYLDLPAYQMPGPFYGRYNFHVVYRNVFRFAPNFETEFWAKDRQELFLPQIHNGRNGNVWSTLIRDLIADFGPVFAVVFLFLFGVVTQSVSDSFFRRPTATKASLMSVLRMVLLFSALHSLFFIGWVVWAILALFAIMAWEKLIRPRPPARRAA